MKIIDSILTKNPCYTCGKKLPNGVKGLMIHSVGCPQPNASVFVKNWNSESYDRACVHAFIDGNTGDVYQCLPWDRRGWHCASGPNGSGNDTHIGVEICEPATIKYTGGSSWVETGDGTNTKNTVMRTYKSAVELFAYLCNLYDLNPLEDGVILSHHEGNARGIASNHGDTEHIWAKFGITMNQFRNDIRKEMTSDKEEETKEQTEKIIYRVQAGAYSVKENAVKQLEALKKAGFDTMLVLVNNLYKVQVGAYSIKSNADNMLSKVKAAGFDAFITTSGGKIVSVVDKAPSNPTTSKPSSTPAPATPTTSKKSNEEIAKEVIKGNWGNGEDRKNRLAKAGYDYNTIQSIVNTLLNSGSTKKSEPTKKSVEEIAKEVIRGNWGNGEDRKNRLTKAGYNYKEVQALVNKLL